MKTKEKVFKNAFFPPRFQISTVQYCVTFTALCILCYVYVQTTTLQKSSKEYSSWNFSHLFDRALKKVKYTSEHIHRERKLVLLWTNYFRQSDWLPSTSKLHCPVQECDITSNRSLLHNSSAVIFHWRNIVPEDLPPECPKSNEISNKKCPILVLFNKEAPPHTTADKIRKLNNKIHLVASYRKDSDVYAPYGKIVKRTTPFKMPKPKPKRTGVCWLVSHCQTQSNREVYVNNLKHYIDVNIYGKCGNLTCPYSDVLKCYRWLSERCKFYLSFENSICKDYSTEKLYYAMMTDMVPIVMGGDDYTRYLPSHSFIDVADFANPSTLGEYLKTLEQDEGSYLSYFKWKEHFAAEFVPFEWFCDVCAFVHNSTAASLKPRENVISWWYGGAQCGSL